MRKTHFFFTLLFIFLSFPILPISAQNGVDYSDYVNFQLYNDDKSLGFRVTSLTMTKPIQPITAHEQSDGTTIFEAKAFFQVKGKITEREYKDFIISPLGSAIIINNDDDPISDTIEREGDWYLKMSWIYCTSGLTGGNCYNVDTQYNYKYNTLEVDAQNKQKEALKVYTSYNVLASEYDHPSDDISVKELIGTPVQVEITDSSYEEKTQYRFLDFPTPTQEEITTYPKDKDVKEEFHQIFNEAKANGLGVVLGSQTEKIGGKSFNVGQEGLGRETILQGEILIPSGDLIQSPTDPHRFHFYYQNNPNIQKIIREFKVGSIQIHEDNLDIHSTGTALNIKSIQQCVGIEATTKLPTVTFVCEYNLYAKSELEEGISGTQIQKEFWDQMALELDPSREEKIPLFSKININWTTILIIGVILVVITSFMFTPRGKEFYATTQKQIKKMGKR